MAQTDSGGGADEKEGTILPYTWQHKDARQWPTIHCISSSSASPLLSRPTPLRRHLVLQMAALAFAPTSLLLPRRSTPRRARTITPHPTITCTLPSTRPATDPTPRRPRIAALAIDAPTTKVPATRPSRARYEFGALAVLSGVTVLWGSQHAVMKSAVDAGAHAGGLNALRFSVAALLLSPWLRGVREREIRGGLELGLWSFLGFFLQTAALSTVGAARSGFLLYLNVKLVPVIRALRGARIPRAAWAAALLALAGTGFLAGDGGLHWATGDSLSVCAALASAFFIVRVGERAREKEVRAAPLAAASVCCTALLAAFWAYASGEPLPDVSELPAALYLGALPTALATVLQAWAQRSVSAERAAVVYAMDPVFGALFANWLLGETFGSRGVIGAALIVTAAFVSNIAATKSELQ